MVDNTSMCGFVGVRTRRLHTHKLAGKVRSMMKESEILVADTTATFSADLASFTIRVTDSGYYEKVSTSWSAEAGEKEVKTDGYLSQADLGRIKSLRGLLIQAKPKDMCYDDVGLRSVMYRLKDGSIQNVHRQGTGVSRKAKDDPFEKAWKVILEIIASQQDV